MKLLATKNTPRDGDYPALQSGYELTFTAPDSITGEQQQFKWKNPKYGVRGFNCPANVRVTNGVVEQL